MKSKETITISKAEYQELVSYKDELNSNRNKLNSQESEIENLKHQLSELKRMIYGSKRERFIPQDDNQISLFGDNDEKKAEPEKEEIKYTRNKKSPKAKAKRTELPAHLPRKEEIIEPEGLSEGAKKIGESVTEILEYIPQNLFVRKIIRPKYIVMQNDEETKIVTTKLPKLPIPKSYAGASLLSHIIVSKFVDHLPFFRIAKILKRQKIDIAESTINDWFRKISMLSEPLYNLLKQQIIDADYVQADETPLPVLTKDKPGATHKGYYWVYHNPVTKAVVFKYEKTRGREGPDKFLSDFSGHLQTDGYTAYNNLKNSSNIDQLACMAHSRRKFEHAKDNDPDKAEYALKQFAKLYDIERDLRENKADFDEIKKVRQDKSVPILKEFKQWLDENVNYTTPKSAIGKAFSYTLSLWPRLIKYTENGKFMIDNNLVENSIRPVALGRKNYLFAGSHKSAQYAAIIYSILASCKINEINPFDYFNKILTELPNCPKEKLGNLLPHKIEL